MKFIKATLADCNIVKDIVHTTIKTIYPHYYPKGVVEFFLDHHSYDNIRKEIETETVLLLDVDGIIVGTGSTSGNELSRLYVLPQFQGLSYGTSLMEKLEEIISTDYSAIVLASSLPGYNLYLKHGYTPTTFEKIITANEDVLCFNFMEKPIKSNTARSSIKSS